MEPLLSQSRQTFHFDRDRFKVIVHYVCWASEDPRALSWARLNRILWYTERNAYLFSGRPLTGATYIKEYDAPRARPLASVLRELEKAGDLVVRRESSAGDDAEQYFALRKPNISALAADVISSLDVAIRDICFGIKATIPNRDAHNRILRVATVGEIVPYYTVFAGTSAAIDPADLDWATRELRRRSGHPSTLQVNAQGGGSTAVEEACKALWWHLFHEPSAGISLPTVDASVFIYRQKGATPTVPDLVALYELDLEELVVLHLRIAGSDDPDDCE